MFFYPATTAAKVLRCYFRHGLLHPRQPLQFPHGICMQGLHQHGNQGIQLQGGIVTGPSVPGDSVGAVGGVLLGGVIVTGPSVFTVGGVLFGDSVGAVGGVFTGRSSPVRQ